MSDKLKIFLDDIRFPHHCANYMSNRIGLLASIYLKEWLIVRSHSDFIQVVSKNHKKITHVSLDHDLAPAHYGNDLDILDRAEHIEETGYESAKWLKRFYEENKDPLPEIFIHSMNPVGAENIKMVFRRNDRGE